MSIPGSLKFALRPLVEAYAVEALGILQKYTCKKLRIDEIILSKRLSSTMGIAKWELRGKRYRYIIKISSKIFTKDCKALKETVYHEVAHLADWQIYKCWGHGETWVRLMNRLGVEPKVYAEPEEYLEAGYLQKIKSHV